jgi:hypothetical protein
MKSLKEMLMQKKMTCEILFHRKIIQKQFTSIKNHCFASVENKGVVGLNECMKWRGEI